MRTAGWTPVVRGHPANHSAVDRYNDCQEKCLIHVISTDQESD